MWVARHGRFDVVTKKSAIAPTITLRQTETNTKKPNTLPPGAGLKPDRDNPPLFDYNKPTMPQVWQIYLAKTRLKILESLDTFRAQFSGNRSLAVHGFIDAYLAREIKGLDPAIYGRIPSVKRSRLYDWESRFRQYGIAGLISKHGCGRKGACGFPVEQQQFVLGTLAQNPSLKPYKIQRSLLARFGEAAMNPRQVRGFLKRHKG